ALGRASRQSSEAKADKMAGVSRPCERPFSCRHVARGTLVAASMLALVLDASLAWAQPDEEPAPEPSPPSQSPLADPELVPEPSADPPSADPSPLPSPSPSPSQPPHELPEVAPPQVEAEEPMSEGRMLVSLYNSGF